MISETRNATAPNEQAQTALALNASVPIEATRSDWVPSAPVQIVVVQIVATLNDWVLNAATRIVRVSPAAHSCQDVMVAQVVHYAAHFWLVHFEAPHSVEVVHSAEVELLCAGVVLLCVVVVQRV